MEHLKDKTRIFVTHGLQYISECDNIYVVKDGQIIQQGNQSELRKMGGEYDILTMKLKDNENKNEEVDD